MPEDKIVDRYHRSIQNLLVFAKQASGFWVYDNSDSALGETPNLVARGSNGSLTFFDEEIIPEVSNVLSELPFD